MEEHFVEQCNYYVIFDTVEGLYKYSPKNVFFLEAFASRMAQLER